MAPPSFSVIIPAYNAAATIVASVRSCLEQSLPPDELIVVDDASTDGTVTLLNQNFGDRVRIISLTRNSGPAAARNVGIAAARGSYIAFQDADDLWHAEKLSSIALFCSSVRIFIFSSIPTRCASWIFS